MPKFKSSSQSIKLNINDDLVWIHDQVNDVRNTMSWILDNVCELRDNISDIAWRKYGSQINTNEVDYKKYFKLYAITFFEKGPFELSYTQIGPNNPIIKAIYTKKRRLTAVE